MIGVPPYSPGRLPRRRDDDGEVSIRLADYFERPLRLTPAEGLALLAAGRALLAVPGADPTGRSRPRSRSSRPRSSARGGVAVEVGGPTYLAILQAAADAHERVEIATTRRRATSSRPGASIPSGSSSRSASGTSARAATCAEDERMFRVDRIRAVRADRRALRAAATADASRPRTSATVYRPRPDDPRVTLELAPRRRGWPRPTRRGLRPAARRRWLEVVLAVSEPAWLERLLLRLGPVAPVVGPDDAAEAARAAAARILARYQ